MRKILFLFLFLPAGLAAQNTRTPTTPAPSKKVKVLIVPWDPHMFNASSDITRAVNDESGMKYDQIEEALRKGMADELRQAFGATCSVITLLDDTARMNEDLRYVYTCTQPSYTPVNAPLNPPPADPKSTKTKTPTPTTTGIHNGQVETSTDATDKFMNVTIISPNLLYYLKKKYGADYVVFVNEIDLDNELGADPYNLQEKTDYKRSAVVHWTIFSTLTKKRIAAGKNTGEFLSTTNTTRKIIESAFPAVATAIYSKYLVAPKS